jgi:lipopolysaccharide/colanic/teichoic acid biosynthesis glycosyltransferase
MERAKERPPDVERAAERLRRPRARARLAVKRALDLVTALAMLAALAPMLVLVTLLLLGGGQGWLEPRERVGRDGSALRLWRFRRPPGTLGAALERIGARELPLLFAVAGGRLSFVGPRALPRDEGVGGPRRLMAPGLVGPAQRWGTDAESAARLDDAYVEEWSLAGDFKLLFSLGRRRALPVRR